MTGRSAARPYASAKSRTAVPSDSITGETPGAQPAIMIVPLAVGSKSPAM